MTFTIPIAEVTVAERDVQVDRIVAQTPSARNREFRVGVAQPLVIPGDVQRNVRNMEPLVIEAARRGAGLVVFSECGITGYDLKGLGAKAAITLEDPVLVTLSHMARKHEIAIATGFYEKRGESLYNSAAVFCPDGRRIVQRKHNVMPPEKAVAPVVASERERKIFEIDGVKCALLICADAGIRRSGKAKELRRVGGPLPRFSGRRTMPAPGHGADCLQSGRVESRHGLLPPGREFHRQPHRRSDSGHSNEPDLRASAA
jgi:hypothetical protein